VATSGLHLSPHDLDPLDNIDEEEFEEVFHVPPADDLSEEKRREEVLEENEAIVKDNNKPTRPASSRFPIYILVLKLVLKRWIALKISSSVLFLNYS
jgi:hypothetical protein